MVKIGAISIIEFIDIIQESLSYAVVRFLPLFNMVDLHNHNENGIGKKNLTL